MVRLRGQDSLSWQLRPGRKPVQVFADAALNQVVFMSGSVLATVPATPTMPVEELEQRVKLLLRFQISRATCWHFSDKIQIEMVASKPRFALWGN